jgi:uncharacterized protein (TIGR03067 family)
MKRRMMLALAVSLLVGAGPLQEEPVKKDLQKLEGTWVVTSLTIGGKEVTKVADFNLKIIFKGDKFTAKAGDKVLGEGTFKIDPAQKLKTMEQTSSTGDNKGKTSLGIYEIDGATLKTCFNAAGKGDRPTEFASKAGTEHELAVYKRDKP